MSWEDEKNMKTKDVRGITIISLVVTIVVLLILAGVSISTLVGENGVVDNAKKTQNNTYYQIAREEVSQLVLEHKLRKRDQTLEEFLTSKVPARTDGVTRKDDNTLIVKKNGYEIEVQEVKAESQTLTIGLK
jgi:type II secretory pathway pseudopilin PulG